MKFKTTMEFFTNNIYTYTDHYLRIIYSLSSFNYENTPQIKRRWADYAEDEELPIIPWEINI